MPPDDFEMAQSLSDKNEKVEKPSADGSEPESFYREAGGKKGMKYRERQSKPLGF